MAVVSSRVWTTLVMLGDAYVPGAMVLAQSMKRVKSAYPFVVMITPDVSALARTHLEAVFDRVVEVECIAHPSREPETARQKVMYGGWMGKSFTKWNCLALPYDEVVFLDSDMLVVENVDDLFDLTSPAASFYPLGGTNFFPYSRGRGDELHHGDKISPRSVLKAIGLRSFVGGGSVVKLDGALRQPKQFEDFVRWLRLFPVYAEGYPCTSGCDEMSLAEFCASRKMTWTNIDANYSAFPWKMKRNPHPKINHYIGDKPWMMAPDKYPDLKIWWDVADAIILIHPTCRSAFYADDRMDDLDRAYSAWCLSREIQKEILRRYSEDEFYKRKANYIGITRIVEAWVKRIIGEDGITFPYLSPTAFEMTRLNEALGAFPELGDIREMVSKLIGMRLATPLRMLDTPKVVDGEIWCGKLRVPHWGGSRGEDAPETPEEIREHLLKWLRTGVVVLG